MQRACWIFIGPTGMCNPGRLRPLKVRTQDAFVPTRTLFYQPRTQFYQIYRSRDEFYSPRTPSLRQLEVTTTSTSAALFSARYQDAKIPIMANPNISKSSCILSSVRIKCAASHYWCHNETPALHQVCTRSITKAATHRRLRISTNKHSEQSSLSNKNHVLLACIC